MNSYIASQTFIANRLIVAVVGIGLAAIFLFSAPVLAQTDANANGVERLDEVVVTGRKRAENLSEVPVSISVLSAGEIAKAGLVSQKDLFDAIAGLDLGQADGTRNGAKPGVRGVQSSARGANSQKVNSFIDGIPMLGQIATLQFSGVDRVEVYRGPQSAAFGRSTFAGAINYVTTDSAEKFEGDTHVRYSTYEQELALLLTGPVTDWLRYRVTLMDNEWVNDDWVSSDGQDLLAKSSEQAMVKLNFDFSDTASGELMYTYSRADDGTSARTPVDPATCPGDSGIYRRENGPVGLQLQSGAFKCDMSQPSGGIPRNNNVYQHFVDQYDDNIADYTAAFPAADTDGDGIVSLDEYMAQVGGGKTYETILKEYSVNPPIQTTDRDRIQGELNFEIGDNLLQFMGMRLEEELSVWNETYSDTTGVILMQGPRTFLNSNHAGMAVNSELEENYAEVRWVSPADKRLRYTLSGSWYAYKFNQQNVRNYGVIQHGLTMADGSPIRILSGVAISEETNNLGASFGLQYDLSDTTTLSFEGRVQDDEVCAETIEGQKCVSTESFAPRIAISKSVGQHNLYAQFSIGNNPAGNNPIFYDPAVIESLLVASGQIVSPEDGFTYDGSDGVHFAAVTYDASVYESYEEETLTNYEVGSKGSFSDGRGSYAVAAYYMFYEDRLVAATLNWDDGNADGWNFTGWADNTLARSNINSGDSEYYGVELETNFQVSDVWAVGGYVTYGKAKYTDYCAVEAVAFTDSPTPGGNYIADMRDPAAGDDVVSLCGIVDGNTVPQHADLTARLSVDATLPNDIFGFGTTLSADWTYKGTYYEDHTNLVERAAVDQLNISANMRNDSWTIRLYVNNVTDQDDTNSLLWATNYYENNANPTRAPSSQPTWAFTPKPGREFGIQVGFEF